jgi:hypothetical protein
MLDERLSGFSESHTLNACPMWQKGKQFEWGQMCSKTVHQWTGGVGLTGFLYDFF